MHYIFTLYSLFFNPYICFGLYKAILCLQDKNVGCEVNVVYEPPEDGLVKAEIYM
jgi:hypothetical protein